ncbi:MAG: hypothetical protein GYB31_11885 [Bacteroidetes bacterium]|nr:hypothetical protein [Bacteroidota bacterium]
MAILKKISFLLLLAAGLFACQNEASTDTTENEVSLETPTEADSNPLSAEEQEIDIVKVPGPRDCTVFRRQNRLNYLNFWDQTAYILIDEKTLTERYMDSKYFMKADLEWTSQCTYKATVKEINIPFSDNKPGDVLNVEILETRGDTIFLKSSFGEEPVYVAMLRIPREAAAEKQEGVN